MWQLFMLIFVLFLAPNVVKTRIVDQQKIVDQHNIYRKELKVEDIKYSKECAEFAQKWAERLATSNRGLKHSSSHKYGENIYWSSDESNEIDAVESWANEKEYFNFRKREYTHKTGHYSQLIWRKTKFVGTGMAIARDGSEYWVSTYYPAGNFIGEKVY